MAHKGAWAALRCSKSNRIPVHSDANCIHHPFPNLVFLLSANVLSFAEESCWDGDKFRSIRREIHFRLIGHGIKPNELLNHEFTADFGLWYDEEDEWLIGILSKEIPDVEWGYFVYFKRLDHSEILILNPENNRTIGSIYPRGRTKQKLSGENTTANIVSMAEFREKKRAEWFRANSDSII